MRRALAYLVVAACRSSHSAAPDGVTPGDADADGAGDALGDAAIDGYVDTTPPTITVGAPDRIVLRGTVITPSVIIDGEVLVEGNLITCVDVAAVCDAMPGATGATIIDTHGVIAPGLVDTHNHILFDVFDNDDWFPAQVYTNHNQWPNETRYAAMLDVKQCLVDDSQGKPSWCAATSYGTAAGSLRCEFDKFGELKGLVAGTTSIVGLPGTSSGCFSSLARSIDTPQNGLGQDKVRTAVAVPSTAAADSVCNAFTAGTADAYLVHVGEGTDASALNEYAQLGTASTTDGCLYAPQTTITHGTAFTSTQFMAMATAGMKLTWSPASNVALYGATTDIPSALDAGLTIALAPDWSMGGSQNMLDELRFADAWDNLHWSDRLSPRDLVIMSTSNAAKVLALDTKLGTLSAGMLADISVFAGDTMHPYDAVLAATPKQVRLVMVGGVVLYGDAVLQAAGPAAPGCEPLAVCGATKFVCVATTSSASKLDQTYTMITAALTQGLADADAQTPGDGFNFAPLAPLVACP